MIPEADNKYFECIKRDISEVLRQTYPGTEADVSQWKGEDISRFQEDLILKANGRISEKWFYTHIKNSNGHLPRIDILNLLSKYVGCEDWNHYKGSKKTEVVTELKNNHNLNKKWIIIVPALVVVSALAGLYLLSNNTKYYSFCLVNALSKEQLKPNDVEVFVLNDGESPYVLAPDQSGCISFAMQQPSVKFVVKGPYYVTDTIVRRFDKKSLNEVIAVKVNDYALMLHLFSKGKIEDWEQRRKKLNQMFVDDAQIFQIMEGQVIGMELYNKEEFINKLTMPLNSLRNISILETTFEGKRIKELRFKQDNP